MKCDSCFGAGTILNTGTVTDCDACCGTGICPVPETGALQGAIDWIRLELTELDHANLQRFHSFKIDATPTVPTMPRLAPTTSDTPDAIATR